MHIWDKLYNEAVDTVNNIKFNNKFLDIGGVASALITKKGNIYTGVCIDTSCSIRNVCRKNGNYEYDF